MNLSKPSSFVVFSGGSACNHILDGFHKTGDHDVSYILGISDNGGSTVSFFFLHSSFKKEYKLNYHY